MASFNILTPLNFLNSTSFFSYTGLFAIPILCMEFSHLHPMVVFNAQLDTVPMHESLLLVPGTFSLFFSGEVLLFLPIPAFGEAHTNTSSMNSSLVPVITSVTTLAQTTFCCVHVSIECHNLTRSTKTESGYPFHFPVMYKLSLP